ncbi:MAG: DUF362 domain-containing protein, partial [Acidobacteria bacterium]|nr:DUF362 domain-containing protein [Acidobacteriota bacterium]
MTMRNRVCRPSMKETRPRLKATSCLTPVRSNRVVFDQNRHFHVCSASFCVSHPRGLPLHSAYDARNAQRTGARMHQKIHRREFMRRSAAAAAAVPCAFTPGRILALGHVDVAVVTGNDHLKSTRKAVEMLGGISSFVPKGSRVALLANVQRWFPGTFTHPEVLRSVLRMCKEAGASEINCISLLPEKNWEATGLAKVIREEGAALKIVSRGDPSPFRTVPVPGGKILKQAEIMQAFFDNDVFINMPITKDHAGNRFTGAMKNLMGLNS